MEVPGDRDGWHVRVEPCLGRSWSPVSLPESKVALPREVQLVQGPSSRREPQGLQQQTQTPTHTLSLSFSCSLMLLLPLLLPFNSASHMHQHRLGNRSGSARVVKTYSLYHCQKQPTLLHSRKYQTFVARRYVAPQLHLYLCLPLCSGL